MRISEKIVDRLRSQVDSEVFQVNRELLNIVDYIFDDLNVEEIEIFEEITVNSAPFFL